MNEDALLARLADLCGIVSEYRDIWGRPRTVGDETKRVILQAMGARTGSADELRREIDARENAPWRRVLPPVLVARGPAAPVEIPVTLPEERFGERLVATVETEDNRRLDLTFHGRDLAEIGRREIDGTWFSRRILPLAHDLAPGYHRVTVRAGDGAASGAMRLIVAPARCWVPPGLLGEGRVWGPAAQLYALRSGGTGGWGTSGASICSSKPAPPPARGSSG